MMDELPAAPEIDTADEAERGRQYIVRALVAVTLVYVITMAGTLYFGNALLFTRALLKLTVLLGTGALVLRGRYNWARWLLVGLFLLLSIEWIALVTVGDLMAVVAAPTHLACAAAVASPASRRYVERSA
jgi:hypothetical protein